jgi:hypothetical protein
MPTRFFTTLKDYLEMKIGDQLDRLLAEDIDDRVVPGSVMDCAIAVDLWDDRPPLCVTRPRVMAAQYRWPVSVYPEPGLRYDFCFYHDCVSQIIQLTDEGHKVGGLTYGLILKNIESFEPTTSKTREVQRKTRKAKERQYHSLMQTWIKNDRVGEPPPMPSHMRGGHHQISHRLKLLEEMKLSHVDVYAESLKRKEADMELRAKRKEASDKAKRREQQARPHS